MAPRLTRADYSVGWVCALDIELTAAQILLDEEHEDLLQEEGDTNVYTLGRIGQHNVVIAALPDGETGIGPAAAVATQLRSSFKSVRVGLMVGIGGGVPSEEIDLRLGDVVVSRPEKGHGGVVQYDYGKTRPEGVELTGFLNAPPDSLRNAVTKLKANHNRAKSSMPAYLSKLEDNPKRLFVRGPAESDVLFKSDCVHVRGSDCRACNPFKKVRRAVSRTDPEIHYGTIASGNKVMRDGIERDKISAAFGGVLCFEMEAAGLMNRFPCLVIRGISDYADSHKNDEWRGYAAGVAAAYAKDLLMVLPASDVAKTQTIEEATRQARPVIHLPFGKNSHFVGRTAVLKQLEDKILTRQDCKKLAIVGLGGIGKTQIALSFANMVMEKSQNCSIFWISAVSKETVDQSFDEIASLLKIRVTQGETEDVKVLVRRRLSAPTYGCWIILVDNADDEDVLRGVGSAAGLLEYLPQSVSGAIIYTSRNLRLAHSIVGREIIEIEKMTEREAAQYLTSALLEEPSADDKTSFGALFKSLDYLPLAITQAAAYMNTNKISASAYLELLNNTEQDLIYMMSVELGDSTRYKRAANAVATTWVVSFQQLVKNENAARLLEFMSCIEWKAIPHSILPEIKPKAQMMDAIGMLCAYSFVTKRPTGKKYDMHRLVHLATRIWLQKDTRHAKVVNAAIKHLSTAFPSHRYENRGLWREYLPHVVRMEGGSEGDRKDKITLSIKVGLCLLADGKSRASVTWLRQAVVMTEDLEDDDPSRLAAQHNLASADRADGEKKNVVQLLEEVVAVNEKVLAEDHPVRLASRHALAAAYRVDGQIKKAVQLLEEVVHVEESTGRAVHPATLTSMKNLAIYYAELGSLEAAHRLMTTCVEAQTTTLGADHPDTRDSMSWLEWILDKIADL